MRASTPIKPIARERVGTRQRSRLGKEGTQKAAVLEREIAELNRLISAGQSNLKDVKKGLGGLVDEFVLLNLPSEWRLNWTTACHACCFLCEWKQGLWCRSKQGIMGARLP
jgi:hypothetical protein